MESRLGGNESRRGRKALSVTETSIRELSRNYRTVELPTEVSPMIQPGLAAQLCTQAAHLRISLLECEARIGSGPSDPYYALLDAHVAVQAFAKKIFSDIDFHQPAKNPDPLLSPECELAYMIQVIKLLIEELAYISAQ